MLSERNVRQPEAQMEQWQKDPFHGWLSHAKSGQPEEGNEKIQEAKVARHLKRLPSFSAEDTKRYEDHREYSVLHQAGADARQRPPGEGGRSHNDQEKRWKDDAFFGWLPGRGSGAEQEHQLHRPLQQARIQRLPSFSEDPELLGIAGKPTAEGVLSVWINGAANLAYGRDSAQHGMRGKPSACVRLKLGGGASKLTATVPADANPRWNTPAMRFEVEAGELLTLEVADLASSSGEAHLFQHFLGQVEVDLAEVVQSQAEQGPGEPVLFRRELQGAQGRSEIEFECLYEPYDDSAAGAAGSPHQQPRRQSARQQQRASGRDLGREREDERSSGREGQRQSERERKQDWNLDWHQDQGRERKQDRQKDRREPPRDRSARFDQDPGPAPPVRSSLRGPMAASGQSFRSSATSDGGQVGVLSVRVLAADNLVNMDTGIMGDVSDPFCAVWLESTGDGQRKRTQTINNNLNPRWNSSPFLFPLYKPDDKLIFEVYNENMLQEHQLLGRLVVPLLKIVQGVLHIYIYIYINK